MGGRALPTLAYKLDRHTRSDYLDCHIYLERGAIHHSSAADSTRPMLIPSREESSSSQPGVRWCLSTHPSIRHWFNTSPHITQEENAGFAFGEPTEASWQGKGLHWSKGRVHLVYLPVSRLRPTCPQVSHLGNGSIAQHSHGISPNWGNVLDLCCPQPRGRATCGCGVLPTRRS